MLCFYINIGIVFSSERIPESAEHVLAMGKHWNPKQLPNFLEFHFHFQVEVDLHQVNIQATVLKCSEICEFT